MSGRRRRYIDTKNIRLGISLRRQVQFGCIEFEQFVVLFVLRAGVGRKGRTGSGDGLQFIFESIRAVKCADFDRLGPLHRNIVGNA